MSLNEERVREALHEIFDPCSVAAKSPLSIVDMGLVTHVDVVGDAVSVAIRPTNRGCTLMPSIMEAAEEALRALPGVGQVSLLVDAEKSWSPDQISERGQRLLSERRAQSRIAVPIEPQQWKRQHTSPQ